MALAPAREARVFQVTIPAGTPLAAPVTIGVSFPPMTVQAVRWRIPPGPSGLMGWRLTMAGGQVLPANSGAWIIADNDADTWELYGQPDSGAWRVTGYNTDIYDHTVYLTFLLDMAGGTAPVQDATVADAVTTNILGMSASPVPSADGSIFDLAGVIP